MEDKRQAILIAARQLLEHGSITVDQVALAAGVAKGTVYLYFDNKQELIKQTFLSSINEISERVKQAANMEDTCSKRLSAMVHTHYQDVRGKMLILQRLILTEPDILQHPKQGPSLELMLAIKEVGSHYEDILKEGMKAGEFRSHDTQVVATAIMAMIHNLSAGQVFMPHLNNATLVDELLQLIFGGILQH